jgi:hypothetical protein
VVVWNIRPPIEPGADRSGGRMSNGLKPKLVARIVKFDSDVPDRFHLV